MKKYFKPTLNVISMMSSDAISFEFTGFESFGQFADTNVESFLANSDNLGQFKRN
ncbi:MAG: hypothetical protein IKC83_02375 [Clostridia bacterium]|nr:hypothetical protein [Clostridia bacterium]